MCAGPHWRGKLFAWGESETHDKMRGNYSRVGELVQTDCGCQVEVLMEKRHSGPACTLKVALDYPKTSVPPFHLEKVQQILYISGNVLCKFIF